MPAPGIHGWREHESPPHFFLKIFPRNILLLVAGRLGGCRYNRFSLQVESVYSDYLRVAILGNVVDLRQDNFFPPGAFVSVRTGLMLSRM
jgi:hypothetical protein